MSEGKDTKKKNEGKEFEKQFKDSVPENIYFLRLKDVFSGFKNDTRSFTPSNPCDAIMYQYPIFYMIEFKSTKGTSFSFDEKIIKQHQIDDLYKASQYKGIISGFIFNFRNTNKTYFIHINDFIEFKKNSGKKSINEKDCIQIGILIRQTIKKVKYHYYIETFIKESQEKYLDN